MAADRPLTALLLAAALLAAPAAAACDAMAATLSPCADMDRPAVPPMDSGCHTPEPEAAMSCCFTDAETEKAISTLSVPLPSSPLEAGAAVSAVAAERAPADAGETRHASRDSLSRFAPLLL